MAVVIRLQRRGTTKRPTYRIMVTDARKPMQGKCLEQIGTYYPRQKEGQLQLQLDRVDHWVKQGAQPSETVKNLVRRARVQKK